MKENNFKEELKAMSDLYVKELALIGCKNFVQSGERLSFTYNSKSGFVYPHTEVFVFNLTKGEGLGELKELIYAINSPKIKTKSKSNVKYKGTYKCPNMDQYEALLNELSIYYDKHRSELTIMFEGYPVKIFPKRHWFTGKKVKDGRGIENLRKELTKFYL